MSIGRLQPTVVNLVDQSHQRRAARQDVVGG